MNENELREKSIVVKQSGATDSDSINSFALSELLEPEHPSDLSKTSARSKRSFFRRGWHRRYINWYLLWTALAIAGLWYLYVYPMRQWEEQFSQWWNPKSVKWHLRYSSPQREFVRTVEFLAVGWFFYFGACIGSFFNVVAWRWPNGRGIVFGGSKCPFCNNRLGFIHNTPILGWMWCRGKCAFCKIPIATRYLWIEVAFGVVFAVLVVREIVSGGANLPGWTLVQPAGFENTVFTPHWHLIIAYLQHSFVFASIMMLVAATKDRLKFPWWGWGVFVSLIAVPKILISELAFIPWWAGVANLENLSLNAFWSSPEMRTYLPNLESVLIGGIGGWLFAGLCSLYLPASQSSGGGRHWRMAGLLLGAIMGWQTAFFNLVVATAIVCLWRSLNFSNQYRLDSELKCRMRLEVKQSTATLVTLLTIALSTHIFWRQIATMIYP